MRRMLGLVVIAVVAGVYFGRGAVHDAEIEADARATAAMDHRNDVAPTAPHAAPPVDPAYVPVDSYEIDVAKVATFDQDEAREVADGMRSQCIFDGPDPVTWAHLTKMVVRGAGDAWAVRAELPTGALSFRVDLARRRYTASDRTSAATCGAVEGSGKFDRMVTRRVRVPLDAHRAALHSEDADEPDDAPDVRAKHHAQNALNSIFEGSKIDATASFDGDDLMVISAAGTCDMPTLESARRALVALTMDPTKMFNTIQCNGGPMLKLH